eukprot:7833290-Alexandrium_andersonii.AAC.1
MYARRTCTRTSRTMCTSRYPLRWHSPACASNCAGACMAPGQRLPGGRRFTPPFLRASALSAARPALVASTT